MAVPEGMIGCACALWLYEDAGLGVNVLFELYRKAGLGINAPLGYTGRQGWT